MTKKIELSNKYFNAVLYVFLFHIILINIVSFTFGFFTLLKLGLTITTLVFLLLKHEKVKLLIQIITMMNIIGIVLIYISIIIKLGISREIKYNSFNLVYMLIELIISIYLFIGINKNTCAHSTRSATPRSRTEGKSV